jgi:hypothetical protein
VLAGTTAGAGATPTPSPSPTPTGLSNHRYGPELAKDGVY